MSDKYICGACGAELQGMNYRCSCSGKTENTINEWIDRYERMKEIFECVCTKLASLEPKLSSAEKDRDELMHELENVWKPAAALNERYAEGFKLERDALRAEISALHAIGQGGVASDILSIMNTYREQEARGCIDTPGGLEHMGEAREKLELNIWNTLSVGQRLKDARELRGHTQEEFAYFYGFNTAAVSHWECGRRDPSMDNLVRLCHALEVSPNWLLQGE